MNEAEADVPPFTITEADFACNLSAVELEALGDLSELSVLHLVGEIPLESFALAALGASVVVMDPGGTSGNSIIVGDFAEVGMPLAEEQGLDVAFAVHTLTDVAADEEELYDIVYAGPTTLAYIENIHDWAVDIASSLLDGGALVMYDEHPASRLLEPDDGAVEGEEPDPERASDETVWSLQNLSDALTAAGLVITRRDELTGVQRFITTAEVVGKADAGRTAFVLVAERPVVEPGA